MKYFWLVLLIAGCCGQECSAQIVRLETYETGNPEFGRATAVCIGESDNGSSVFLTAAHNFRKTDRARVWIADGWRAVDEVNVSRSGLDVASFEVRTKCRYKRLGNRVRYHERVWLHGYGPEYHGTGVAEPFCGTIYEDHIQGCYGWHPITGDSGGPVDQDGEIVGLISGFVATMARSDRAESQFQTVYSSLGDIQECLSQVYIKAQCGPSGCPIYIRPRAVTPMFGPIPIGPTRIIGEAVPVPRPPQTYVPVRPQPDPISTPPQVVYQQGPKGDKGDPGPPGQSVSQPMVEAVINAWLDAHIDELRGQDGQSVTQHQIDQAVANYLNANAARFKGSPGERGPQGLQGPVGPAGPPGRVQIIPSEPATTDPASGQSAGEIFFDVRPRGQNNG